MPSKNTPLDRYPLESEYTLMAVPADSEEGREKLEAGFSHQMLSLDNEKWPRAIKWFTNSCFVYGNQYTNFQYNGEQLGTNNFSLTKNRSYIPRVADNQILRPFETNVSLLTQTRPVPTVTPNSDTPEDEDAAKLSEVVFGEFWERPLNMSEKQKQVAAALGTIGLAAIEIEYTDTDIPTVRPRMVEEEDDSLTEEQKKLTEELTGEVPKRVVQKGEEVVMRKDLVARVWNGFHLNVNPSATSDPSTLKWIVRSDHEDAAHLRHKFKMYAEELEERPEEERPGEVFMEAVESLGDGGSFAASPLFYWNKIKDILDSPQTVENLVSNLHRDLSGSASNQCVFSVVDVKPSPEYPRGRTLMFGEGKLLFAGDARAWSERYPFRWHPYAFYSFWTMHGQFWPMPLVSPLVPLQKRINAIDELVRINRMYMTIGQWLIPKNSTLPDGLPSGIPGQQIQYDFIPGGPKPDKVTHEPLPGELLAERNLLIKSIADISGTNRVLEGENTSGIRAGIMLEMLRKEALSSRSNVFHSWERATEQVAQNILIEVSLNFNEDDPELTERLARAAREYSIQSVRNFTGMSLRDNIHIKISVMDELMKSPEAQKQLAAEVMGTMGPNLSPAERQAAFRTMGFDEWLEEEPSQVNKARRMVSSIRAGAENVGVTYEGVEVAGTGWVDPNVDNAQIFMSEFQKAVLHDSWRSMEEPAKSTMYDTYLYYRELFQEQMKAMQQQMAQQEEAPAE